MNGNGDEGPKETEIDMDGLSMKVIIDGDAINAKIADAILDSALGDKIREHVEKNIKDIDSYNSAIKHIIDEIIKKEIYALIHDTYKPQIHKAIKELMTDTLIESVTALAFDRLIKKEGY